MKHSTRSRTRKPLVLLGLAVTPIALAAPVTAGAASSTAGSKIQVIGSGVRAPSSAGDVPFTFSVRAVTRPRSNGVYGTFSGSFPHDSAKTQSGAPEFPAPGKFVTFSGVVTCLRVSGDAATIGGVLTSGFGYDDTYTEPQRDQTGDWFITTVRDPKHGPDTMSSIDWGDRAYLAAQHYNSFAALCRNPVPDLGTKQFRLASGDIQIRG
jgi:hypothetical protein